MCVPHVMYQSSLPEGSVDSKRSKFTPLPGQRKSHHDLGTAKDQNGNLGRRRRMDSSAYSRVRVCSCSLFKHVTLVSVALDCVICYPNISGLSLDEAMQRFAGQHLLVCCFVPILCCWSLSCCWLSSLHCNTVLGCGRRERIKTDFTLQLSRFKEAEWLQLHARSRDIYKNMKGPTLF